ncbi:unnamed protein product [Linum trigynum]|uniref:Uncharacterized protein n=1 Tax=Linum trigynum TaxID=586398 RepID=A0AAV2CJW4_9ROSI
MRKGGVGDLAAGISRRQPCGVGGGRPRMGEAEAMAPLPEGQRCERKRRLTVADISCCQEKATGGREGATRQQWWWQ